MYLITDTPPDFLMWATFGVILATIVAFAIEKYSVEAVSLASIVAYLIIFSVTKQPPGVSVSPADLVIGFANPALITVLALLVIGQALFNTDALEAPSRMLAQLGGGGKTRTIIVLLVTAGVISAFMNNTPVVVMFIPIIAAIAAQQNFDAAKALMPLSFIGILGGMTTLIGSSTNLLVAGVAEDFGIEIGFFDFSVPGAIMAAIGSIYVIFIMPLLLRQRSGMADEINTSSGRQFIAQIQITPDHPLKGAKAVAGLFRELEDMTVRMVMRRDIPILAPFEDVVLSPGDVVIVAATRRALTRALSTGSANLPAQPHDAKADPDPEGSDAESDADGGDNGLEANFTLAEVVVAPGSRFSGRTLQGANIRSQADVVVMGVQRKNRMQRKSLGEIRLEPGDTLLVGGLPDDVARLKASRDLLLLEWSAAIVPMRRYAPRAIGIFGFVIIAAATGMLPIMVAALIGCLGMILAHCLNIRQAARAFDSRIFMMVGASLAGAVALEQTGGAAYVAELVVNTFEGQSPAVLLSAFFLATAILTNLLSNNATAVLFTPIAIRIAEGVGVPPEAFIVAVIFAANCSFATPVGYQTNLLVMGPGRYKFADFILAGIPLVIILWLSYTFIGPWYYGL